MPSQAVVRVEEGKLIVRQRGFSYQPVTHLVGERAVTSYQAKSAVSARTVDPADVSVFDVKGNRLQTKAWKDKLKNDVHALVSNDGKLPNPRELALFKEDTLIIVLPGTGGGGGSLLGRDGYYSRPGHAPGCSLAARKHGRTPGREYS